MKIKPGVYRHSKTGNLYKVHFTALHSETFEETVVYEALYDIDAEHRGTNADKRRIKSKFWVRPAKMFLETITLPDGSKKPRFEFVKDAE